MKEQIKTLLHTAQVDEMFRRVIDCSDQDYAPFLPSELSKLKTLFNRCTVVSHNVFKDNEWVLGPRRDVCGASTCIALAGPEGEHVPLLLTWYFRDDEQDGFVEEFSLVIDGDDDVVGPGDEDEDEDEDENEGGEDEDDENEDAGGSSRGDQGSPPPRMGKGARAAAAKPRGGTSKAAGDGDDMEEDSGSDAGIMLDDDPVTVLEGKRTQRGSEVYTKEEVLEEIEAVVHSGLALQTLLRFVLLVTRTECARSITKLASIANGYDEDEDGMFMRKYLCGFVMPAHAPNAKAPAALGKRPTNPGKAAEGKPPTRKHARK